VAKNYLIVNNYPQTYYSNYIKVAKKLKAGTNFFFIFGIIFFWGRMGTEALLEEFELLTLIDDLDR
jgi:hypothetical protein